MARTPPCVRRIKPYVIMVVGVNGVGKTTTIGKLAHAFKTGRTSVMLGAADTFRAAAVDQLRIWSERVGVPWSNKAWAPILRRWLTIPWRAPRPKVRMW
jgi:signal recognition particle GTPase